MSIVNPKPPSAWKDSGVVHLEEPTFAVKHEAVDEETTVEPCLPPCAWKDTSVLHLKDPDFAINHEVVDDETSVLPCLLPCGVRHLEDPSSAVKHEVAEEGTSVDPCLLSSTWKDTGIYHLKESGFVVEPEVVDEPTTVEPSSLLSAWKNNGIPHQEEPAFSIKHEVVDEWAGREPCFLTSVWDDCGIPYLENLGYGDRHEMVHEGTSVEPCLPSSMWRDTGIFHLNDIDFSIEHEVVDEGTTVEPPLLSSASKDTGILHVEEPAFAIKHEVVTEWTSVEPCFMSSVWNDSGILHHEDPDFAIKHELVDEGASVEPFLPPPPSTWKDNSILHPKEPTDAVEREVLDEDTSVEPCLLPNAWRDTNVHLEESDFVIKHEVADEGTSVEPCLPPSSWIDTGISHIKEPSFSITHEALDEGTSIEPCLLPSARKDTGILHLKEPAFVIKHEVVEEGTSVEPCLPPNNLSPLNLVRKDKNCRSRKRVSPLCDFPAGNGRGRRRKLTRLGATQDNHLFQRETMSNIHVENLVTDVNEITEEPPADNTYTDKILENVVSRKRGEALEGSFKAHKGGRIKKATLFSKTDETKGLEKVSKDTNDKHGKRMQQVDVGSNNCNSSPNKSDARRIVRDTLRLFHGVLRKLVQGQEKKKMGRVDASLQISAALKIFKDHGKYINTKKMMGPVPGVEIGDLFNYRVELDIIGLHKPIQSGIDFIKQDDKILAISVVASGRYDNDVVNCDILIYTGQGGNVAGGCKQLEDQRLERGNLALKNSIDKKNLVRVIRGFKERKMTSGKRTTTPSYIYDGLYTVERYWQESGRHGMLIYKFELKRVPHQLELTRNIVKQSKKPKIWKRNCTDNVSNGKEASVCGDISEGKETPPFVVNNVDDQKPPSFTYITEVIYPDWCRPIPPKGCDCKDGCFDSQHCACSLKNGGEIPYNHSGALVEEKSLVFECGPSCKCPPTCHNRVSQHGIKLPLEIFKTVSRGWGVRCLSSISSGSFVCEYIGELLDDKEAEQRIDSDDYLFDIGQNHNDSTLREGLSALIPHTPSSSSDVVENVGFTLDAGRYGIIGRFINHSCSPNLFAQNVLYDHADKRIPHIMFYAAQNIPLLQELTYHYNYTKDQVFDSEGNIKRKRCYCGSSECTGRLY